MISNVKLISELLGIFLYFVYSSCGLPNPTTGGYCADFELLQCGDGAHQWMFCPARKANTRPVAFVHVDLRFETRHCHALGIAQNFGLNGEANKIWTANWCYGTFLLCYRSVAEYDDSTRGQSDAFSTTTPMSINPSDEFSTTTPMSINPSESLSPENDYNENVTSPYNATKEIGPPRSDDEHGHSLGGVDSWSDQQHVTFGQDETSNNLDDKMKFWLLFGIVAGGLIIIVLIAVITYVIIKGETTTKERHYGKSKSRCDTRYYRDEKPSVTELLDKDENIYADIGTCERLKCEDNLGTHLKTTRHQLGNYFNKTVTQTYLDVSNTGQQTEKELNEPGNQAINKQLDVTTSLLENVYDHVSIFPVQRCSTDNVYNHLFVGDSSNELIPSLKEAINLPVDVV